MIKKDKNIVRKDALPLKNVEYAISITDKLLDKNQYHLFKIAFSILNSKSPLDKNTNYLKLFEDYPDQLNHANFHFFSEFGNIDYLKALKIFRYLITLENKNQWIFCLCAGICSQRINAFNKALDYLDQAINLNYNFAPIINQKASCNLLYLISKSDKISKRKKQFILREIVVDTTACIDNYEYRIPENYSLRSYAYKSLGEFSNALEDLNKLIEIKTSAYNLRLRGELKINLNQYQSAINDFDKAISLKPDSYENYLLRGSALQSLNQYLDAIINFSTALELIDESSTWNSILNDNAKIYFLRGNSFFEVNQFEKALTDYQSCEKLNRNTKNSKLLETKIQQTLAKLITNN